MEVALDPAPSRPASVGAKPPGARNYCRAADSLSGRGGKKHCNGGMVQHLLSVLAFSYTRYHIGWKGRRLAIFSGTQASQRGRKKNTKVT